jgi:hypothetical protein
VAEPVREAPHHVGEGRELSWVSAASILDYGLSDDNFGIG